LMLSKRQILFLVKVTAENVSLQRDGNSRSVGDQRYC